MTSPLPPTPRSALVPRVLATILGGILTLLIVTSFGDGTNSQELATASIFAVPGADDESEPIATTVPVVQQTAPLQIPTATPAPTSTPIPQPTAVPTEIPTPTPVPPTPEPAPEPAFESTGGDTSAEQPAALQPAPTAPPAVIEPAPTTVEPTATAIAPEPTATAIVDASPTVEPTATTVETAEPTTLVEPTATPQPTATPVPVTTIADLENYVLGEINDVRAKAGLGPVALDPAVSNIARDWSQQMATGGFFSHRPGDQLGAMLPAGWRQWGENIASAPDIFWAQSSLENSPGHYANMVGSFTHVGIGVHRSSGQVWVTQNFVQY